MKHEQVAETSGMLLRCLRVMENVTFLNQANQRHLIQLVVKKGMRGEASRPFIALLLDAIDTLSAVGTQDAEQTWQSPGRRESGREGSEGNHSDAKSSGGIGVTVREGYAAALDDESGNFTKGGRSKQLLENEEEEVEQELKKKCRQTAVSFFAKRRNSRNGTSEEGCPISSPIAELKSSKMVAASQRNSEVNGCEGKKAGKDPFDFDEDSDADDQLVEAADADSCGKDKAGRPKSTVSPGDHTPLPLAPRKDEHEDGMPNRGGERQAERTPCAPPSPAYRAVGRPASSADSMVHGVVENCLISAVKVRQVLCSPASKYLRVNERLLALQPTCVAQDPAILPLAEEGNSNLSMCAAGPHEPEQRERAWVPPSGVGWRSTNHLGSRSHLLQIRSTFRWSRHR